jgi:hypothetical protein
MIGRALERGHRIGAAKVKFAPLTMARADLPGKKFPHVGGRHQSKGRPVQVELGHAGHIEDGLGRQNMLVEEPRTALICDVQDELRGMHRTTIPISAFARGVGRRVSFPDSAPRR